jgi:hypothetical protein
MSRIRVARRVFEFVIKSVTTNYDAPENAGGFN